MLKSIMNFCCLLPVMGHVLGQGSTRGRHVVDSHASRRKLLNILEVVEMELWA